MSDLFVKSFLEFLKLAVIILIELSVEPTARIFELGWKDTDVIGEVQCLSRLDMVQQLA